MFGWNQTLIIEAIWKVYDATGQYASIIQHEDKIDRVKKAFKRLINDPVKGSQEEKCEMEDIEIPF